MEPRAAVQQLSCLEKLMEPDLGDEKDFYRRWLAWEREVQETQHFLGGALSGKLRIAIVRKRAPQ